MTNVDCYGETGSRGARDHSTCNWATSSLAWTAKRGGKALGRSVRTLRVTGALITGAHRATTKTIKASGRAADAFFASTAGRLPLQIPIGARIGTKKRMRRRQKQSAPLREMTGLKIAAALDAGDTGPTEDATERKLAQALRVRAVENAELRSKLELPGAGAEDVADEEAAVNALQAGEPGVDTPIAEPPVVAFKVEAEEQLQAISSALRALEREPFPEQRACLVEVIFRQAHSMKCAAHAVLRDVEAICQSLENVLARIKKGDLTTTPELFDALYKAVDAIGDLLANPREKKTADISSLLKDLGYLEKKGKMLQFPRTGRRLSPNGDGSA